MILGSFNFDMPGLFLERSGRRVEIPARALEVLRVLAERPNRVVDKKEIFARVWSDGFVEESNLWQQIHLLRKVLAVDPRVVIENVPRRGYRLVVPVQRPPHVLPMYALAGLALLVCVVLFIALRPHGARLTPAAQVDYKRALYHLDRRESSDLALAQQYLDRVVTESPDAPDGYAARAVLEMVQGLRAPNPSAQQALFHASYVDERTAFDHGEAAYAFLVRGARLSQDPARRAQSDDDYRKALSLMPNDPTILSWYGFKQLEEGSPAGAERAEAHATEVDPTAPIPLKLFGMAAYYNRDLGAAGTALHEALAVNPSDDESWYYLGLVEQLQLHPDDARSALDRAVALHSTIAPDAKLALAYLDAVAGKIPEAKAVAIAASRPPAAGYSREGIDLASLWMVLGKPAKALAALHAVNPKDLLAVVATVNDPRLASLPFRTPQP